MPKTILAYYIIRDCGDGSAAVDFFETESEAEAADDKELQIMGVGNHGSWLA